MPDYDESFRTKNLCITEISRNEPNSDIEFYTVTRGVSFSLPEQPLSYTIINTIISIYELAKELRKVKFLRPLHKEKLELTNFFFLNKTE